MALFLYSLLPVVSNMAVGLAGAPVAVREAARAWVDDTDRRIDRQGAMGAAMLNMATSAAGIRTQNRLGVGLGFQNRESALSIGYQRAISDRATVTLGGAFTSDDQSVGVGAGFGW